MNNKEFITEMANRLGYSAKDAAELQKSFTEEFAEKLISAISGGIMLAATIVLFIMGFCFNNWELCWIGYPIGGVLIGIVHCIFSAVKK